MDKELVRLLLPVVNDPEVFSALLKYVETRVSWRKDALVSSRNMEEVSGHQSAIRELLVLKGLRDEVRQRAKELKELGNG